jgi:hypothetical protein
MAEIKPDVYPAAKVKKATQRMVCVKPNAYAERGAARFYALRWYVPLTRVFCAARASI